MDAVVLRGQTHSQVDLLHTGQTARVNHLLGNGEQREDEVALIPGLVALVRLTLARERPVAAAVLQNLISHGGTDGVPGQTGDEVVVDGFDGRISVVNSD